MSIPDPDSRDLRLPNKINMADQKSHKKTIDSKIEKDKYSSKYESIVDSKDRKKVRAKVNMPIKGYRQRVNRIDINVFGESDFFDGVSVNRKSSNLKVRDQNIGTQLRISRSNNRD